jgi:hypothetical protein
VRGAAAPDTAVRTASSLSTLQEQMIIAAGGTGTKQTEDRYGTRAPKAKGKMQFTALLMCRV